MGSAPFENQWPCSMKNQKIFYFGQFMNHVLQFYEYLYLNEIFLNSSTVGGKLLISLILFIFFKYHQHQFIFDIIFKTVSLNSLHIHASNCPYISLDSQMVNVDFVIALPFLYNFRWFLILESSIAINHLFNLVISCG